MAKKSKNPFVKVQGELKDVPKELRQKVMDDVAMAKLIMELATLFTGNYSSIIESVVKSRKRKK